MPVQYQVDDHGVAYLQLDSPETRNALSNKLLDELLEALDRAKSDSAVRVVVLGTTHDKVFSAGGDLKAFSDAEPAITKYAGLDRFPRLFLALQQLGKPTICAASGDVLAGAFGLALACDLILARKGIRFGCPEINVGVFPFMISALIYRSVPRAKANELMLLGDLIGADEALALQIVNAVVPSGEFDDTVRSWAHRLATKSPLLTRLGKDAIATTRDMSLPDALSVLQAQLALALTTDDIVEGVTAFRQRRDPHWSGR
ncbi:enoyl-CoA hydratase/isomerase family protein [Prauserella flavalba]|uniref:enoyl-CoA hydratase/isomerase family protein n=1 Tax=Prauserella flavalba TaxID=1477506 RepID=UPI0036E86336